MDMLKDTIGDITCRPYSHTDRRMMLSLDKGFIAARLFPLGAPIAQELLDEDEVRYTTLRSVPPSVRVEHAVADLPCVSVSWSPRAPLRLRVESRRFHLFGDCHNWTDFCHGMAKDKLRRFFTMQLLHPADNLS